MANSIIEQHPKENRMPVGQPVIFSVSNTGIVANETKVKFVAQVHISSAQDVNLSTTTNRIGIFKTTPNNAGVGMFDFSSIIENYVKADNLARAGSAYKTTLTLSPTNHPIHLIDKFSGNNNAMRYFGVQFKVEYLGADATEPNVIATPQNTSANSDSYKIFNGYLKHTDLLELDGVNFGFDIGPFFLTTSSKKFLTNAPLIQYANADDYGTVTILNRNIAFKISFDFYDQDGASLGSDSVTKTEANGAYDAYTADIGFEILYFGCYPANLKNYNTTVKNWLDAGQISYYTFKVEDLSGNDLSDTYRINVNCPTLKGYEPIRLTWLNQWGGWDYYTFTMKSIRKVSTKGSTYNQLEGTWNESSYRLNGYKGGKKAFRVNATETITINTDFVNESESEWFEDLINSPEVYILKGYQTDETNAALNQYVVPVRLTTSSYTRKTIANDKLMQYTFEVEKSKTLRTQSV